MHYHKANNEYFYCVNREQLGQYWRCVVEDRYAFCPDKCDKCNMCKEMSDVFAELQDYAANSQEEIPYQPILWRFSLV